MKKSTQLILEKLPMLEKHMKDYDSHILSSETLEQFNDVEQTFLRLLWFFENPEKENFNIELIYQSLDDGWLSLALESIFVFFKEDTYLLKDPDFSLIKETDTFYNQSDFAVFLNEHKNVHQKNYSRQMVHTYLKRGLLPKPDLIIGNTKYWKEETSINYLKSLQ